MLKILPVVYPNICIQKDPNLRICVIGISYSIYTTSRIGDLFSDKLDYHFLQSCIFLFFFQILVYFEENFGQVSKEELHPMTKDPLAPTNYEL